MREAIAPALALRRIAKHFGRVTALDNVDCTIRAGTVHALLGENGAGKTTLMRIAFGLLRPESGSVQRNGSIVRFHSPADAIAAGIGMVQQHFSLVPALTVAENVALGGRGRFRDADAAERVRSICAATGWSLDPHRRVDDLPIGMQQRVEILKAFARSATLLILDEPTAVLAPSESRELLRELRAFAAAGNAVVLITHKLRDALDGADDITVLRQGRVVHSGVANGVAESALVEAILGHRAPAPAMRSSTQGSVVLRARNVTVADTHGVARLHRASATVCSGEIVGIAGVEGNGQSELLRVLAGRVAPTSGTVEVPAAVGFVPADRYRDALVPEYTLVENFALAGCGQRRGVMRWRELESKTRALLSEFEVVAQGPLARASSLSGGNQQRFIVGRELSIGREALVCENPTRGLDAHAAEAVYARLRRARDEGVAIALYSSDLDELLLLADRILVCFAGEVGGVARSAAAIAGALVGKTE